MNFLNEIVYYLVLVLGHSFTLYNPDEDSKIVIGDAVNSIIIIMLIVNVSVMIYD